MEVEDYFDILLDSVMTPGLASWHQKWSDVYKRDPQKLLVLLLSTFHSPLGETKSYNRLMSLPFNVPTSSLDSFLDKFERYSTECVGVLTPKGQCLELLRHMAPDVIARLNLYVRVNQGVSVLELVTSLRGECMSVGQESLRLDMDVDVLETSHNANNQPVTEERLIAILASANVSGSRSNDNEKKSDKKKGPRCFRCQGFGHISKDCATKAKNE